MHLLPLHHLPHSGFPEEMLEAKVTAQAEPGKMDAVELRHLRSFVAVAEELHFGRAAQRLHMAQPPLSQQIRLFERNLGARLFDRSTRSVQLTAAGQSLLEPARRILAEAHTAKRAVLAAALGEVDRVTVGFAGASSYDALPRLTRAVTSEHPGIELVLQGQIYSGDALRQIADGTLDLGFVCVPTRRRISARLIRLEELVVALPEEHPQAQRSDVQLNDLAQDPFVTFPAARGSAVRDAAMHACKDAGFTPFVAQEAPDYYNLLTLVGAGVGVALVVASSETIAMEHVIYRPLVDDIPPLPIVLAWGENNESAVTNLPQLGLGRVPIEVEWLSSSRGEDNHELRRCRPRPSGAARSGPRRRRPGPHRADPRRRRPDRRR